MKVRNAKGTIAMKRVGKEGGGPDGLCCVREVVSLRLVLSRARALGCGSPLTVHVFVPTVLASSFATPSR